MKALIDRTLFWFTDGDEQLLNLNNKFSPWGLMFNRLLNEKYCGKKIKYINLYFKTKQTYTLNPKSKEHYMHYYGGHLWYNDVFDMDAFISMSENEQVNYIWKRSSEILLICAENLKNNDLSAACNYAYEKGISLGLNPNFEILQTNFILNNKSINASILYDFQKEEVTSNLILEIDHVVVLKKNIDSAALGNPFFFIIYKKIEVENNVIIIKGRKDAGNLPMRVEIPAALAVCDET